MSLKNFGVQPDGTPSRATTRLRQMLSSGTMVAAPFVLNAFHAKIAEQVGFQALYMTGFGTAAERGYPDVGLVTQTEMVENARYIASAVDVPVFCDADTGYGNPINVTRTIREYERAGVAGCHIEDQVFPKKCGFFEGKLVIPMEEHVQKIRAALAARRDPDFVVIARTDAYGAVGGSMEEAIWRGRAYADAGVDLVWCELSNSDRAPAIEFARAMRQTHPKLPLAFNYSSSFRWHKDPDPLTFRELGELGYKFIFITLYGAHAAMYSVWNAMHELVKNEEQAQWALERTKVGHPTESHHVMARVAHFQELERRYIPGTDDRLRGSDGFSEATAH